LDPTRFIEVLLFVSKSKQIHRMKKTLQVTLATAVALALTGSVHAQTSATLADFGGTAPPPGTDDVSQLGVSSGSTPTGMNYYFNNGSPPGQTFTTGSHASGYILNSVYILTDDNSGQIPAGGQVYELRIYSVAGSTATLVSTFDSQGGFVFTDYDWLQWTNLGTILTPNTQYAYTLRSTTAGWERLASTSGNPYAGGEAVLIPTAGGALVTESTHDYDAAFMVGLTPVTTLTVAAPTISPSSAVTVGTAVTLSTVVAGGTTYAYQWQTDGGSGGALTNIPSATSATLALDTTGSSLGLHQFAVAVTSGSLSVTSSVSVLTLYVSSGATLTDMGTVVTPGLYDISQLDGGGSGDGLNYYDDNSAPPGQTFTTGTNTQGYYLSSVTVGTGGGGSGSTLTAQGYNLWIYSVSGNNATLLANYTNASFSFAYGDWLTWSGFTPLVLKPNTTYAYAFRRNTTGWAGMTTTPTTSDLYTGGQICLIPQVGGTITFGATGTSDAAFDLVLLPIGVGPSPYPFAGGIAFSPGRIVVAGTAVTLSEPATGAAPFHYQWQTDGGTGGSLTNLPANDSSNLVVTTTGWAPGAYKYDVVVTNAYGASTSAVATLTVAYTDATALLTDIGATDPQLSFADDISQLVSAVGTADGLNYYFDNGTPPGQTFTTGTNPNGYTLTSLAIRMAGNAGGLPSAGQAYLLRLYSVSGSTAVLYATYTSATNFTYTTSDWLRWSGLAVPLAPNKTYAYTFGRITAGSGWERLANTSGNPYSGGQIVLIPTTGGAITFGGTADYDGAFVVGLAFPGFPIVTPTTFAPASTVYAGTRVTASASVTGTGPFTYQWQTDGGNTGVFTNIPAANSATLAINTTGLDGLAPAYRLVATNSAGPTLGEPGTLTVNPASSPMIATDITSTPSPVFPGSSTVTFSVSFVGTLPISYQWQVDKGSGPTSIVGQTNTSLTLTNLKASDVGSYSLHAANALGYMDSGSATVYPQPTAPVTVNFQWHSTEGGDVGNYSGLGVAGFGTGTFWNQVVGPSSWSPGTYSCGNAYADDGTTIVGTKWTLVTGGSWDWTSTPTIPLLDSAASAYAAQSFTFGLPNGIYNVVLFSCNGTEASTASGGTVFTLNGMTRTALPTQNTSFVQGNTYVVFSNVVVTSTSLAGTWEPVTGKTYGSVNGAQLQYRGPAVTLEISRVSGGQVQLQWPEGTLLEATSVTGPWTTNSAPSPYTLSPAGAQKFYRLIVR
jgi:hypothetical protein